MTSEWVGGGRMPAANGPLAHSLTESSEQARVVGTRRLSVEVPVRLDKSTGVTDVSEPQAAEQGGEHGIRRGVEMVEMRIVIPPGQRLPKVSAHVSISRTEANELRDALELVQASGSSGWSVDVE